MGFGPEGIYCCLLSHLVVIASDKYILMGQDGGRSVCFFELVLILVADHSHELYIFGVRVNFVDDPSCSLIEARVARNDADCGGEGEPRAY